MTREHVLVAGLRQLLAEYDRPVEPTGPRLVKAGESLQAALDAGGSIELEAGATFEAQGFRLTQPKTLLSGKGAMLVGTSQPALTVEPGAHACAIGRLGGLSKADSVFLFGRNGQEQTTLDSVPRDLMVAELEVIGHRGKRAFEINASGTFVGLRCRDCWADGVESKGINVINTPGPVWITDADIEAGSIGFLAGGDPVDIPGVLPQVHILRGRFTRPAEWRTDGKKRSVKTGIEFKAARDSVVEDCDVIGVWADGQNGFGCTVTPRSGASTVGVRFEDVRLRDVTNGYNVTGHDDKSVTPEPTTGIAIAGGSVVTDRALVRPGLTQGRGTALQLTSGPFGTVRLEGLTATVQHSLVYHAETSRIEELAVIECTWPYGTYGLFLGNAAHGANRSTIGALEVSGNTISGASAAFKRAFPLNGYQ